VELLFRVFGDRYERASVLVTSNLPLSEWNQIFQCERMNDCQYIMLAELSRVLVIAGDRTAVTQTCNPHREDNT
jgi:DNA replication protein DnaC